MREVNSNKVLYLDLSMLSFDKHLSTHGERWGKEGREGGREKDWVLDTVAQHHEIWIEGDLNMKGNEMKKTLCTVLIKIQIYAEH